MNENELKNIISLEGNVLASCFIDNENIQSIRNIITEDTFIEEPNKIIWSILKEESDNNNEIDITSLLRIVVKKKLEKIVTPSYIGTVSQSWSSDPVKDSLILQSKFMERGFTKLLEKAHKKIQDGDDVYTISKWLQDESEGIFTIEDEGKKFKDIITDTLVDTKKRMEGKIQNRLLTNSDFDKVFDLSPDETIFIAALSKIGKTKSLIYLISQLFKNNQNNVGAKWFSLEDPEKKIIKHFQAIETGIPISKMDAKKEGERLTDIEYQQIEKHSKNIENYDISLVYGSYNVEKVVSEGLAFVRKRKHKHNFIIIDNFNILVDNAGFKNQLMKENHVAGQLHQLRLKSNSNGLNTTIIILDHLAKSTFDGGLERGYRGFEGQLKGSGKKAEIMTQLIFLNKPSRFPDLIEQYKDLPPITLSNGEWGVDELLMKLTLYEAILSRNGVCETGKPIRFLTDLDSMEFVNLEDLKITNKSKQKSQLFGNKTENTQERKESESEQIEQNTDYKDPF